MPLSPSSLRLVVSALLIIFAASPLLHSATPSAPHTFHVAGQWKIGGEGGWGHPLLDPASHRLFIPRTDRVTIIDTETGKVAGEVSGMTSARAVALDGSGLFGYVTDLTDGTAGFVRIFDRTTLKVIASLPAGINPDSILFEPATRLIFAFNTRSPSVTVIDTATNKVAATIALPARPGNAVAGHGTIFVTLPALGEIIRIDATTRKIAANLPLAPCTGPSGLTFDPVHRQLFTTCEDHTLIALNADTGSQSSISPIPPAVGDMGFVPERGLLFVADALGTVSIFHRDSPTRFSKVQQLKTEPGARTMVVSTQDPHAYLLTAHYGQRAGNVSEELGFRPTPLPGTFEVIVVSR